MDNDNSTPMVAKEYDKKFNQTIPYYSEFYLQNQTTPGFSMRCHSTPLVEPHNFLFASSKKQNTQTYTPYYKKYFRDALEGIP